ncbi:MAG TPA: protocatechuate 3,4-dioxygenase [Sphingomicrobium sp.]|nr:protocatechuate 3,4-dioxygenase [Sphingomicrobium sp.]
MTKQFLLSRRAFAGAGLASAGLMVATGARAVQGRPLTAESPMGPFFPLDVPTDSDADLTLIQGHSQRAAGQVIEVTGRVLDQKGNAIAGARLDLWQANAAGRYAHPADPATAPLDPHFQGFASVVTDAHGEWRIITVKPAGYDSPIGHRPPHIHFDVRGKTHRNVAQLYFPEDAEGNARDLLYKELGAQAGTSVAIRNAADPNKYVWDVVLMG